MAKPAREFFSPRRGRWTETGVRGVSELVLAADGETGIDTRLVRLVSGASTDQLGPFVHDFWEEAYLLDGSVKDLTIGQTFRAGSYACRPPGMPHGPVESSSGCVVLEVRYR